MSEHSTGPAGHDVYADTATSRGTDGQPGTRQTDAGDGAPPVAIPANWKEAIPADLRDQPALQRIKDVPALARSYMEAQRLVGAQKIAIPRDGDEKGWGALYDRLGRPASPDRYELPVPQGTAVDGQLETWARQTFHEAGLSAKQARLIFNKWNEMSSSRVQSVVQETELKEAADLEALELKWGAAYDRKVAAGQRAARRFADPATLDRLEAAMGAAGVVELMANIGEALAEDALVDSGGGRSGFAMTPAEARAEIDRMMADQETVNALEARHHPGHAAALDKKRRLFKLAYPG